METLYPNRRYGLSFSYLFYVTLNFLDTRPSNVKVRQISPQSRPGRPRGRSRGTVSLFLKPRWGFAVNATHRPLYPGEETRYSLYRRPDGPQGRSERMRGTSPPRVFHPRTVQPAASRYTVYAMKAPTVSDTAANTSVNLIFVLYCWLIHVSVTETKNVYCATGMFDIQTRQARSQNHCCRGITYFLCVCARACPAAWACAYAFSRVTLLSNAPYCIVICGLSGSTAFCRHYLINGTIF